MVVVGECESEDGEIGSGAVVVGGGVGAVGGITVGVVDFEAVHAGELPDE